MAPFAEIPINSFYSSPSNEVSKEPDLLEGWWISESLFSLERRAIFSKTWICVSHRSRFNKPGDYISVEIAGFPIFIILGKDRITRAFHNVCRHRAYTVTKKAIGSSLVLGCRYHGWSYDTKGNLVKAPQFDGVEGFDKTQNGLFKIRTCTDRAGFIHVNLDAGELDHAPDCEGIVSFAAEHEIDPRSHWIDGLEVKGEFNWKVGEALGLPTTSPNSAIRRSRTSLLTTLFLRFQSESPALSTAQSLTVAPLTTLFSLPNTPIWFTVTILPISSSKSSVKCDIYSSAPETVPSETDLEQLQSDFHSYVHALEQYYAALKSTRLTKQPEILPLLRSHSKEEKLFGHEILPAACRKEVVKSDAFVKAERVCKQLDSMAMGKRNCVTTGFSLRNGDGGRLDW